MPEGMPRSHPHEAKKNLSAKKPRDIEEQIFENILLRHLSDAFAGALEEEGYTPEQVENIEQVLEQKPPEDILRAIAIPEETRERYLGRLRSEPPEAVVAKLIENAKKHGFTLGFHVSPRAITGGTVRGTEIDHRDNDLPMAYYSTDYHNLYLKKGGSYLYVIRAEVGEHSSHRQDNDGRWGRAAALAIVARFNLSDIKQEVEKRMKEYREEQKKEAAE